MQKKLGGTLIVLTVAAVFLLGDRSLSAVTRAEAVRARPAPDTTNAASGLLVTLRARSGATIPFKTQNGVTVDGVPPERSDVPYLVLYRNGVLSDPSERTLIVEVRGLVVPPGGVTVTLTVETQHGDPDLDTGSSPRIPVWRESHSIANTTAVTQMGMTAVLRHEFGATVLSDAGALRTPTDYFRYEATVTAASDPGAQPLHSLSQEFAFLMESQWIVPLPPVQEEARSAAPDELIVHTCDMFPFRRDIHDASTWLPREEIPDYLRSELLPAMVEAFRIQTDVWGFPWLRAWTGYRPVEGAGRLSVALSDGETWFYGPAPSKGHAGISINANGGWVEYATLTDGLVSTFHHELFHNHQRDLNLQSGGNGDVNGADTAWDFFAEGTAILASVVGQPEVELARTWGSRAYLYNATSFLGREGVVGGDLNKSYERLNAYHAAIYWRFLYEQCGGLSHGVENPAAGMAVIRRALQALYAGDSVDILSSGELVGALPQVMDRALEGSTCPFQSYEDSLLAFGRTVYGLRLGGGFHDPHGVYPVPPFDTLTYAGVAVMYQTAEQGEPAGIPSSFGIDIVEVALEASVDGRPLTVEIYVEAGAPAQFRAQVWKLVGGQGGSRPAAVGPPQMLEERGPGGHLRYTIPALDTAAYDRLGLVIIRVDARESADPNGAYTLVLSPEVVSGEGVRIDARSAWAQGMDLP
jgi:hypothetical protein